MELQLNDLKELIGQSTTSHSFKIGEKYLIRCITFYYVGEICAITDSDIVLQNASWVANTGRFHNALKDGSLEEVEPFINNVIVPRGCIVDATQWNHPLPSKQI